MQKKHLPMGSVDWANQVFASPPVDDLKGHSKRTQHHRHRSSQLKAMVGVQGRNEACTALAIEYLIRLGLLKRAKPQPFETDMEEFGSKIKPDFLAEGTGDTNALFVIETKSAKFLTRIKNLELDEYRQRFAQFRMKYLVWTDQRPLNHSVRHNLINMRAGDKRDVKPEEIEHLVSWVGTQHRPNLSQFYADGFDLDCLYAAAWKGRVFFPITQPLTGQTVLGCRPLESYQAIFLDCENNVDDWWRQLASC